MKPFAPIAAAGAASAAAIATAPTPSEVRPTARQSSRLGSTPGPTAKSAHYALRRRARDVRVVPAPHRARRALGPGDLRDVRAAELVAPRARRRPRRALRDRVGNRTSARARDGVA